MAPLSSFLCYAILSSLAAAFPALPWTPKYEVNDKSKINGCGDINVFFT
jgi:hypothetical protein